MQTSLKDQLEFVRTLMKNATGDDYTKLNDVASTLASLRLTENMDRIENEWLEKATRFDLGESVKYRYGHNAGRQVFLETRKQRDGSTKWIVIMDGFCLGKSGRYFYEGLPSSRTEKFIKQTRFDSKEEAFVAFSKSEKSNKNAQLTMK